MWFAFVDESGKPKFGSKDIQQEPIYVVPAIIVHETQIKPLYHAIEEVKRSALPKDKRDLEIHANEIVHGNKRYRGISLQDRIKLMDGIFDVIRDFDDLSIVAVVIDKEKVLRYNSLSQSRLEKIAHGWAFKLLAERLRLFLNRQLLRGKEEFLLWIIDDSVRIERERTRARIEQEIALDRDIDFRPESMSAFYTILPPLFAHSHQHIGLQLADVVGYVISRKFRGISSHKGFDFDKYYNCIYQRFEKDYRGNPIGWGLKIWYGGIPSEKDWFR